MSDLDLGPILDKLQLLLENLPNQLPLKPITGLDASHYVSLIGFKPDNELVDLTGSKAGALNVHLERVFEYAARSTGDGILPILERGPAICAMHDILSDYCNEFQEVQLTNSGQPDDEDSHRHDRGWSMVWET